jgi:hypothetical protein
MIRIVIEAETVEEALKEARLIGKAPDPSYITIKDQTFPLVPAEIPDEGILTENTSPPVEPVDKGEFRPIPAIDPAKEKAAREAQAAMGAIPAIDALPKAPAPPPPPPAATAAPDVDARGIPWDGRIHAGNKAQTKDKSWKRRRGVSVEEVQRIEAELVSPAPTTSTVSNPSSTAHTMQAPPPPPAELPGTEPPPVTFDQVMREAGQRNLGITNLNALTAEVTGGQIGQIALIADKPAYIQAVYDRMTAS